MGMVGTLIGLVLMLGNMSDPKAIGPAMAVALLTTMYGAIIANVLFLPLLNKLEGYTEYEVIYREMVVTGLRNIARSESPPQYSGPDDRKSGPEDAGKAGNGVTAI